jgi:hypothetical protein
MPPPISFTGRLNLQDLLDIHSCHLRETVRRSIRQYAIIFSKSQTVKTLHPLRLIRKKSEQENFLLDETLYQKVGIQLTGITL